MLFSYEFATGMIDAYFKGETIPKLFWQLMAFYMSVDVLSSIPWAIEYGDNQLDVMIDRAN